MPPPPGPREGLGARVTRECQEGVSWQGAQGNETPLGSRGCSCCTRPRELPAVPQAWRPKAGAEGYPKRPRQCPSHQAGTDGPRRGHLAARALGDGDPLGCWISYEGADKGPLWRLPWPRLIPERGGRRGPRTIRSQRGFCAVGGGEPGYGGAASIFFFFFFFFVSYEMKSDTVSEPPVLKALELVPGTHN